MSDRAVRMVMPIINGDDDNEFCMEGSLVGFFTVKILPFVLRSWLGVMELTAIIRCINESFVIITPEWRAKLTKLTL